MEYYIKIKNIRTDKDIKQYEFAKMINVKQKSYNLYENGKRHMKLDLIDKILIKLNISLDYLLELSEIKNYPNSHPMKIDNIPNNIKKYRKLNNKTQEDLAKELNINQQTISEYERGNLPVPLDILRKLALLYNTSSDTLVGKLDEERKLK